MAMQNVARSTVLTRRAALEAMLSGAGVVLLAACTPAAPPAPAKPTEAPKPAAPAATTAPAAPAAAAKPTEAPKPAAPAATTAPAPPAAAAKPTEAPKPATATPKKGGTLRIGQVGELNMLDPQFHQGPTSANTWLPFDRLIEYDTSYKPKPMLAESWDVTPDYKQIKFNLRKGVQYHSGREFTSEDVKWTFERIRDPKIGVGGYALQGTWFTTVETPDKYTVILKSEQPRPNMFDLFEYLNMSDRESLEGPNAKTTAVGTGAYKFVEYSQGSHATYQRNPNYWKSGTPYFDEIRTSFHRDAQAMVLQFESGALDAIRFLPVIEYARLKDNPKFQGLMYPAPFNVLSVGANVTQAPTNNKIFRQALSYAIDRKRFAETAMKGLGVGQSLPWVEGMAWYEAAKNNHYTFDLEKAKALIAQSGITNPEVDMIYSDALAVQSGTMFAEIYKADLAKIGVKLNVIPLEAAALSEQVNGLKVKNLYFAQASNMHLPPGTLFNISRPLNPANNNQQFKDQKYTDLVQQITVEVDPAKQKAIYAQINDLLLDESFQIYVSTVPTTMMTRAGIHGLYPDMHGGWQLTDAWMES